MESNPLCWSCGGSWGGGDSYFLGYKASRNWRTEPWPGSRLSCPLGWAFSGVWALHSKSFTENRRFPQRQRDEYTPTTLSTATPRPSAPATHASKWIRRKKR